MFEQLCKLLRSWIDKGKKPIKISMKSVAEGVETKDQVDYLKTRGYDTRILLLKTYNS
ncbi:MAG: hypothetical protein ACK5L6_10375 [Anaerorhabdus sp.]|uniref:hypothetical protein n=1 Tax=Anaerorhabdus sp. TaxID=1872524 RepID=UPI003A84263F